MRIARKKGFKGFGNSKKNSTKNKNPKPNAPLLFSTSPENVVNRACNLFSRYPAENTTYCVCIHVQKEDPKSLVERPFCNFTVMFMFFGF